MSGRLVRMGPLAKIRPMCGNCTSGVRRGLHHLPCCAVSNSPPRSGISALILVGCAGTTVTNRCDVRSETPHAFHPFIRMTG